MKNPILVFDFDGTIADTFHYIFQLSNQLAKEFDFNSIATHEINILKDKSFHEVITHLNIPLMRIPTLLMRAKKELHKDITHIDPVQGLIESLNELKALGYRMGILTSNSAKNVQAFLDHHDLNFFDFISASSKLTGKNKRLTTLAKKEKIALHHLVYIGDETRDIEAAQKAGVRMAAVTWGYNSSKALKAYNPDFLLHHPNELAKAFL